MMRASDLAATIGAGWPDVLERLGIARQFLVNKHTACPNCGGTDRYRFTNKFGHGNFYCNGCGPGDGFALLMRTHGWDFRTALQRVKEAVGSHHAIEPIRSTSRHRVAPMTAPPPRVLQLTKLSCGIVDCADAVDYLSSRHLWPLPSGCSLRAHPSAEYFDGGNRIGRYPALIADVRNIADELVTVQVTYLEEGRKLTTHEPRKLLSPLSGHEGCAVRLMPITGDTLGIGEGIETCLAASQIHGIPTWAALNTSLLTKFTPPPSVKHLVIFADADVPGLTAAAALMQRLQGKVTLDIRTPKAPEKDFADELHHMHTVRTQ